MAKKEKQAAAANQPPPPATAGQAGADEWENAQASESSETAPETSTETPPPASPPKQPEAGEGTPPPAPVAKLPDPHFKTPPRAPRIAKADLDDDDDEGGPLPKETDFKFPEDLKQSLELLHEARALPQRNRRERTIRRRAVSAIEQHVYRLQQGPTAPHIGASDFAASQPEHAAIIRRHKLKSFGQTNPEVKALIADFDKLVKENAALLKENAELKELLKLAK